ncbi:aldehyde dehydrogenase (NAD(P)(+)) ald5 [Saitozyma podzolica]|uniref:Aldehyde dehydrogenase (NAD(P)(+)) ald5 n=1 Tax=Saitozyma podzolica TaxID=1890683 RepID=A0A427XTG3_9TREE|nr:aldehyde dehydrogenase (NAD(P)(+)) ald5 [Saitozyma podzolica]
MSTHAALTVPTIGELSIPTGLFINNEFRASSSGQTVPTINPANGETLLEVSHASQEDVDEAVRAARKAFETAWGNNVQASERGALLNKLADLMERDAEKLAALESLDSGKGIRIVREIDLPDSVACLRYYAGLADKFFGQTIPHFGKDKFVYTIHQPIGVCGQIIPWNYPLLMWAWKVAPALAAGCCIVMKPSELTPLSALYMCQLVKEAGIPAGVFNTVPGLGATTGDAISRHMDIDKVAFTGSVMTGRRISIAAAESNLKKVTLELGGKSPSLIFESANIEEAADWSALGIWFNSGQDCTAGSRIYVHESIYETFIAALKKKAEACAIGQAGLFVCSSDYDETTSFGPLISEAQRDKVLGYISSGVDEGARLVAGGKKWSKSGNGYWVEPTIIADVKPHFKVVQEEIFGPVVVISKFSTESEALTLANSSTFGLAAAVHTNDARQAMRVTAALDAGTVWCNQYGMLHPGVPFGGFKMSGVGRELGTYGLEAYTQVKAVHQNLAMDMQWPI